MDFKFKGVECDHFKIQSKTLIIPKSVVLKILIMDIEKQNDYNALVQLISKTYTEGYATIVKTTHSVILNTYWQIGQYIVEYEQKGNPKAVYGLQLLANLAKDLILMHGKGFSRPNLNNMRMLYLRYPICQTLSDKLSWSHYIELISIEHDLEREFYEKQAAKENWDVRELRRQKKSALFLRLAASTDKLGILQLAKLGHTVQNPNDIIKEPFVFEFLKIPDPYKVSEKDLEKKLLDNLQTFLLELGKGFTFVGRQYKITLGNKIYKVDLVFYHRFLRCFVLIDLKINPIVHEDIGQMNFYMGYFAEEENAEDDNPPIGIVLTRENNQMLVKYATYGMSSQLFVAKYQLYLPDENQLRQQLEHILNDDSINPLDNSKHE
jgi:predicted nuclease of restriction endonuclease-like (RecB) superfamily